MSLGKVGSLGPLRLTVLHSERRNPSQGSGFMNMPFQTVQLGKNRRVFGGTVSPSELNHGSSGSSLEGVRISQ